MVNVLVLVLCLGGISFSLVATQTLDYEQSLCFLIVRGERSEKNRPRESWPHESCCLGERRKKRATDKASAFDLCVAPTTQKCDWLMLDSSRQDEGNNWIAVN